MTENTITTQEHALDQTRSDIQELAIASQKLTVDSDESVAAATDLVAEIKRRSEKADGMRRELVKPLNDHVDMINGLFKKPLEILARLEASVKAKVTTYRAVVAEERRKAQQKAEQEAREEEAKRRAAIAANPAAPPPPVSTPKTFTLPATPTKMTKAATATATFKTKPEFEVVDAALVPREYLKVDETKIRKVVNAGVREIPGVHIWEKEEMAVAKKKPASL